METVQKLIEKGYNVEFRMSKSNKYLCLVSRKSATSSPYCNASGENLGSLGENVVAEADTYETLINNLPFEFSGILKSNY